MQNLNNDNAIANIKSDLLGRTSFAKHVADILKLSCLSQTDSFVFGLYGEWGEGKTSFINLVKEYLGENKNNQQAKNHKKFCIVDTLFDYSIKIPLFFFILFFSFEDFILKYDFFINLFSSTYNINYNIFILFFCSFILKVTLLILIIKMPTLSLSTIFSNNKFNKTEPDKNIQIIDFSPWNMIDEKTLLENFFLIIKKIIS